MKTLWAAIAAGGLLAVSAWGQELPLDVFVTAEGAKEASKIDEGSYYGEGEAQEKTIKFGLKVTNKGMEALSVVVFKLYAIGGQNWLDKTVTRKKLVVTKVLEKTVDIPGMANIEVEMGEATFKSTITHKGNVTWYGGLLYDGYVLEIDHDGKVDEVKAGNQIWRNAYEDYLAKNH